MFDDPFALKKSSSTNDIFGGGIGLSPKPKKKRDSRRSFTRTQKNEIWAQQNGKCAKCHSRLDPRTVEYDHKKGWADRGKTVITNGQALCANCHKIKTHKSRLKKVDKKRKTAKPKDPFSGGLFGGSSRKRPKNPFDFGL